MNNDYDPQFEAAGQHYNVDPQLLKTIFHVESNGNPKVGRGTSGEIGGMQFMPATANQMKVQDPADMSQAIPAAAQIIRQGLDAHNGDVAAALQTYNGGAGGPSNPKTFDYVLKAQKLYPQMKLATSGAAPAKESDDPSVTLGEQILSGGKPSSKEASDPSVALGEQILGRTTSAPATKSRALDTTSTPEADTAPVAASNALQSGAKNFAAGAVRGVEDVGDIAAPWLAKGVNFMKNLPGVAAIDRAIPMLGRLDEAYSQDPSASIAARNQAYDQQYGNSLAAGAGRFAGQVATTLPVTGGIGSAGEALIGRVGNPLLQSGINLGSSALQGGAGAAMTGGDIGQGAIAGGALGAAGQVAGAASNMLQPGGAVANMMHSKIADKVVQLASAGIGLHLGDISGLLVGQSIGPILKDISMKYGAKMANSIAEALNRANTAGLTTGGAGNFAGKLQPNQ